MEDLKQIQEFFSKPLDEVMSLDDEAKAYYLAKVKRGEIDTLPENPKAAFLAQMTKDQMDHDKETLRRERGLEENVFVEAFKLQKALKGMGYDVKVKHLDDFGKDVFEIYFNNPADADESIFYDAKKLGYDNVRVFANPQESIDEASKKEENEFHKKLDKLVHKTFGHSSDEKKKMEENALGMTDSRLSSDQHVELDYAVRGDNAYTFGNDPYADDQLRYKYAVKMGFLEEYNSGIYYDPAKERNAPKAKEASKSALERVKDMIKKIASEQKMGEALSDYEEKEANYDELYGDYKYKVDEAKPKKGHGEKISKEVFAKLKGKTVNYKGADYKVIDSEEAIIKLKHEDGDTKTINLKQFNDSGLIDEIIETVLLGRQLNEELCPKGKAYIKKRQAAGEKSSAYLSGRAVKVCKGQMKG